MVDADGATDINDFKKVFDSVKKIEKNGMGISAGSRNHLMQEEAVAERKWYRKVLGLVNNFIVNGICGVKLKDT
jgi:dolichyl-phosphate beta-glucosyltransferase